MVISSEEDATRSREAPEAIVYLGLAKNSVTPSAGSNNPLHRLLDRAHSLQHFRLLHNTIFPCSFPTRIFHDKFVTIQQHFLVFHR
ncbi:hypothetical protein NIES4101_66510 [Calothrix sp. NIES-4101]|nr:hypothetical protein NIES4101_66510 [Calothrix sp. NIES-4101]